MTKRVKFQLYIDFYILLIWSYIWGLWNRYIRLAAVDCQKSACRRRGRKQEWCLLLAPGICQFFSSTMSTPAPATGAGNIATFNIQHGFPEALVRGMRSSFLGDSDYHHLTQCETLDDIRLNLTETDYSECIADSNSITPNTLQKAAVEKVCLISTLVRAASPWGRAVHCGIPIYVDCSTRATVSPNSPKTVPKIPSMHWQWCWHWVGALLLASSNKCLCLSWFIACRWVQVLA